MRAWATRLAKLEAVSAKQLFFVGGAPRSGTTWLQQMLDLHPDVSCRGEGHFWKHLAVPLETAMAGRNGELLTKNTTLFQHTGGYPGLTEDDVECLLGTAILLCLRRQCAEQACKAIGEKTPENVFHFDRLKRLFPTAKFLAIARDPRDLLASAWHMFHPPVSPDMEIEAKFAFIRRALPSIAEGAHAAVAFGRDHPGDCLIVTYEQLHQWPELILAALFRFLGVSDRDETVRYCIDNSRFEIVAGRPAGVEDNRAFLRKGVVGGWQSTLTAEMSDLVLRELNWMFVQFGWVP